MRLPLDNSTKFRRNILTLILSNQEVLNPLTHPLAVIRFSPLPRALLALILSFGMLSTARRSEAQTELSTVGEGRLKELSHKRQLRLSAELVEVVETITLGSLSQGASEALYHFDLPATAAITEMSIEGPDGQRSVQGLVDALAATRLLEEGNYPADMGVLRMIGSDGQAEGDTKRYELRVFPVPAQKSCKVVLRWHSPVQLVSGNYSLRFPARGSAEGIARTEIELTSQIAMGQLYGGDKLLSARVAKGQRFEFFAPRAGDLVVQGQALNLGTRAHAEIATLVLSPTSGVLAIRVVVPDSAPTRAPPVERALLLIDVSRSLDSAGREATGKLVDGLMTELGTGTQVEAILFDRQARAVLGSFQSSDRPQRSEILRAIQSAKGSNGSNLEAALALARSLLADEARGRRERSLVVIVSDGMLPTTLRAQDASDALGAGAVLPRVLAAVLVPDSAPLPDLQESALSAMAFESKGRVIALRYQEANTRAKELLKELSQPAPLQNLQVELDQGSWVGADLKGLVAAGTSVTGLGYYEGGVPRKITITGKREGVAITLAQRKLGSSLARSLAQNTLAATMSDSFPGSDAQKSRQEMQRAAASFSVVTEASAVVAVDKKDGFARDRLAMAKRWGPQFYRRMPPPAERAAGASWARFRIRDRASSRGRGRTGQLDADMVASRVKAHVIPLARACYERELRKDPRAAGSIEMHIEVARGEVQHAALATMPLTLRPMHDCVLDAIYAMPIPRVRIGDDLELVSVARYPLRFRMKDAAGKASVAPGPSLGDPDSDTSLDPNDPLAGLPD